MSDQAALPVTFPPGTELPVKGKVEVTGGKIEISNIPTVIVGNTQLRVVNGIGNILQVEVMNEPAVKVGNEPTVKVGNEPTVKVGGEVNAKITNVVKVEGLAASPVAIKGAAGEEEAAVTKKRLRVTEGFQRKIEVAPTIELEERRFTFKLPESPNALYYIESMYFAWKNSTSAEKSKYSIEVKILDEKELATLYHYAFELPEQPGAGTKNVEVKVSAGQGLPNPNPLWNGTTVPILLPIPLIHGGLGTKLLVEAQISAGLKAFTTLKPNVMLINNEGTL